MKQNLPDIVKFAFQIIEMHNTIKRQAALITELESYKDSYTELLNNSVKHGETMMHNMMEIVLLDGVVDKMIEAKAKNA